MFVHGVEFKELLYSLGCNVLQNIFYVQQKNEEWSIYGLMMTEILISVMTTIVKDDWQLAYSLDWRYGSVLGNNSLCIHAA